MNQIESVAMWIGVVTGITGVALSFVAGWFAHQTNQRSNAVSDQTIKSLQKIESAVDRTADDTRDLIRIAWHRLVARLPHDDHASTGLASHAVASGTDADARDGLRRSSNSAQGAVALEERFQELLSFAGIGQDGSYGASDRRTKILSEIARRIEGLSPVSVELLRALLESGKSLQANEYDALVGESAEMEEALRDLRRVGLIAKVGALYDCPSALRSLTGHTLSLFVLEYPNERRRVVETLSAIGYIPRWSG